MTTMHHISIVVEDLPAAIDFFTAPGPPTRSLGQSGGWLGDEYSLAPHRTEADAD